MQFISIPNGTSMTDAVLYKKLVELSISRIFADTNGIGYVKNDQLILSTIREKDHKPLLKSFAKFTHNIFGGDACFRSYLDEYYCIHLKGRDYKIMNDSELNNYRARAKANLKIALANSDSIHFACDGLQTTLVNMELVNLLTEEEKAGKHFEFNCIVRGEFEFSIALLHLMVLNFHTDIYSNLYIIKGEITKPEEIIKSAHIGKPTRSYEEVFNDNDFDLDIAA